MLGVAVLGAGRRDHHRIVSVSAQLTVGIAAFIADRLHGAGGRSAGVGGLAAELIPLLVYLKSSRVQLVSEILQCLSAALAAEPMICIVAAMVNILDLYHSDDMIEIKRTVADHLDDLRRAQADGLGKQLQIILAYASDQIGAGVQIVAGAFIDEVILCDEYACALILVHIAALFAAIVIYRAVLGAGLGRALDKLDILAAACALGGIIAAFFNKRAAVLAVFISGVALSCFGCLYFISDLEIHMGVGVKLAVACAALSALSLSLAAGRAAAVGACARGRAANSALLIVHACDLVGHPVIIMVVFRRGDLGRCCFDRSGSVGVILFAAGAVPIFYVALFGAGRRL